MKRSFLILQNALFNLTMSLKWSISLCMPQMWTLFIHCSPPQANSVILSHHSLQTCAHNGKVYFLQYTSAGDTEDLSFPFDVTSLKKKVPTATIFDGSTGENFVKPSTHTYSMHLWWPVMHCELRPCGSQG